MSQYRAMASYKTTWKPPTFLMLNRVFSGAVRSQWTPDTAVPCCIIVGPCPMERRMRIVVEPSDYVLLNLGDTAMLEIAFARLRAMFPEAVIEVFTDDTERLAQYCPTAVPVNIR